MRLLLLPRTRVLASIPVLLAAACAPAATPPRPNLIVIVSDDQGYTDLGVNGVDETVSTPHLDELARDGIRFVNGYVTAPQCTPSRAGLLTGRYQQRFGLERIGQGPLPHAELTIAERLAAAGYVSGQVGKWHLESGIETGPRDPAAEAGTEGPTNPFLPAGQGFDEYFCGGFTSYVASHDLAGNRLPDAPAVVIDRRFRVDVQTDAALSFIDRHRRGPFFLYLAYLAPHVPLESPEPYFSRTPASLPGPRRQALAMIAAMDAGIGRIRSKLRELGIEKNTLVFFVSDNGAPVLELTDGSRNDPLVGGKGMLTDGGIRTPFLAAWPGTLPAGKVFEPPVITLDVAATAIALAGLPPDPALDGVDLMPFLLGAKTGAPHDVLYWRWRSQAAIRAGRWKLVFLAPDKRYLFDLERPEGETRNLVAEFPDVAADLEKRLRLWTESLKPPGLPDKPRKGDVRRFVALVDRPAEAVR